MSSEQYKHWFAGLPVRATASTKIALCGFSFPISDEKRIRVCFEGVGIEVGRQQIENFGSRGQISGIGNDPEPES